MKKKKHFQMKKHKKSTKKSKNIIEGKKFQKIGNFSKKTRNCKKKFHYLYFLIHGLDVDFNEKSVLCFFEKDFFC